MNTTDFVTKDGIRLATRSWLPEKNDPKAIIIALHGFNDYSNFFQVPGDYFRSIGIGSYAYDQRGFGKSPNRGLWAGVDAYKDDLSQFTNLVKRRHPNVPIYLLGESMGGAVVIVSMTSKNLPPVDGVILAAPAVWGRETMPWYQRTLLWLTAHTVPTKTVTGKGLGILPSDNIEMLRALGRDPQVIKQTRVETLYGLVNLMDKALHQAPDLKVPTLMLYGEKDQIIPTRPTYRMLNNLPGFGLAKFRVAFYENGYHMLLRDLQAPTLWNDIAAWLNGPETALPSGADQRAEIVLSKL